LTSEDSILASSSNSYDNIHPGLSHHGALAILEQSLESLDSASDYYMAVAHLVNFPGNKTEEALLRLIENSSSEQAVNLARRKAVEVLGRLGVQRAIPSIGRCLRSNDHYLVENAAWALLQLNCQDVELHQEMCLLLNDPTQSRRVLIQALAGLEVHTALPVLQSLQDEANPGVRGAALAGVAQLSGDSSRLKELEDHLTLPNQMDRQSAIQDLIDCRATYLLPSILKAPVSPVFRLRALRTLWPGQDKAHAGLDLLTCLDSLMWDQPEVLVLAHCYDTEPTTLFLFEEFFGTDFSRCYLALSTLKHRRAEELWPTFWKRWQEDAYNDYGAHYFFIQLLGSVDDWPSAATSTIESLLLEAMNSKRPQFSKSKVAACLTLKKHFPDIWCKSVQQLLSSDLTASWELRYAALMGLGSIDFGNSHEIFLLLKNDLSVQDPDPFVDRRRQLLISENRV
jgi:bilin biosynthesis protein